MGNFRSDRRGGFNREDRGFNQGNRRFGNRDRGFGGGHSKMFNVICSACNERCQVPFKPTGSKPVLCSNCFRQKSDSAPRASFSNSSNSSGNGISQEQFKQLNAKLDRIILILQQLELDTDEEYDDEEDEGSKDEDEYEEKDSVIADSSEDETNNSDEDESEEQS